MNRPSNDIAKRLEELLRDPDQRARWKREPLAILEEVGFPLDDITDENRKLLSDYLSSLDLGISWKCAWCETWVFSLIVGVENAVFLAIIAAIIVLLAGSEGGDEAAAAALLLDSEGVIEAGVELEEAEVEGLDAAADTVGITSTELATACIRAFKAAAELVKEKPVLTFFSEVVLAQFDSSLASQICAARKDCSG